jgi:uroporphyrinogen-III synthase
MRHVMKDRKTLAGLNVLVTRPAGQGGRLAAAIEAAGGQALEFPLLIIEPVNDAGRLAALREQLQQLDQYQIVIFISSNAARFGLAWIDRYWPRFPAGIAVIAVGPATAAALAELPCQVHTVPRGVQSEDLLRLPLLRQVDGLRIALFRGVGGRELLAATLRERGAQVDYLETYRRRRPDAKPGELAAALERHCINAITVTSGEILDSLCQLVDIRKPDVVSMPLLVPSERVRQQALSAGFRRVYTCQGASDEAIITMLAEIAAQ